MSKEIFIKSSISAKQSPGFKKIRHSAKAGLSQADAIERNIIGKHKTEKDEDDEGDGEYDSRGP